jgi:putative transposase
MQYHNTIIGKLLTPINRRKFKHFVDKYNGDFAAKKLSCWEQFVAILLGQVGNCSSLRDIVSTVNFHSNEQYHLGIKKDIARSTLSDANATRDWRIFRDLFFDLVSNLNSLEQTEVKNIVEIIDSSPIGLDLNTHKWAEKTQRISGLKLHLIYDLTRDYPTYFEITGAKTNDITMAKTIKINPSTTYVFDKGYTDYNWWKEIDEAGAFFVTRLKKKANIEDLSEIQETSGILSSQLISFASKKVGHHKIVNNYYGQPLKKVMVSREKEGKAPLILITNDLKRSDEEIAELYKKRWQIELFFKWIKQNLKIKNFLGRSENAIKTQICIALISFVLMRLAQIMKEICKNMSLKTLITIAKNSLFSRLTVKERSRKYKKNPNQLQFKLVFSP